MDVLRNKMQVTEIPTWKLIPMIIGCILIMPIAMIVNRRFQNQIPSKKKLENELWMDMFARNEPRKTEIIK